jgi:hypothetical protein
LPLKPKPQNRRKTGKFQKGVSGNPGGRPKTPEIFKSHTEEAQKKVVELIQSEDEDIALKAATLILAYSLGRPTEHVEVGLSEDLAVAIEEGRKRAACAR